MLIEVDCGERTSLIAEIPGTGVRYTSQAAGCACRHPVVEGAMVAQGGPVIGPMETFSCLAGCFGNAMTLLQADEADGHLASFDWQLDPARDVKIDRMQLAETFEGWWRVTFTINGLPYLGVLCGWNCD